MHLDLNVSLPATLGCGQAHRWIRKGNVWEGVLNGRIVTLEEREGRIVCGGTDDKRMILEHLRHEDDLDEIYNEISKDPYVRVLAEACPGLRILKQDPWECIATYLLATNANVRRIMGMVDSVCRTFGKDLGGRHSFPTAEEIVERSHMIPSCKLGYREKRFIELAEKVADGILVPDDLEKMSYRECSDALKEINGIGDKVADCVSLFAFGHLNAFPIDARIERIMDERYGVRGNYKAISSYASKRFGRYAGYAQELLYHSGIILGSQAHVGGSHPI